LIKSGGGQEEDMKVSGGSIALIFGVASERMYITFDFKGIILHYKGRDLERERLLV